MIDGAVGGTFYTSVLTEAQKNSLCFGNKILENSLSFRKSSFGSEVVLLLQAPTVMRLIKEDQKFKAVL